MTSEVVSCEKSYRQSLSIVVASLCLEANYESAEEAVLETLAELLQSCKYFCKPIICSHAFVKFLLLWLKCFFYIVFSCIFL